MIPGRFLLFATLMHAFVLALPIHWRAGQTSPPQSLTVSLRSIGAPQALADTVALGASVSEQPAVTPPQPIPVVQAVPPPKPEPLPVKKTKAHKKPSRKILAQAKKSTIPSSNPTVAMNDVAKTSSNAAPTTSAPAHAVASGVSDGSSAGGGDRGFQPASFNAAYLNNPKPNYPNASKRMGEEGTVKLRVEVDAQGRAQSVRLEVSSDYPRLDQAALLAVQRWRFVPARRGTQTVAATVIVPVQFHLR